MNIKHFALAASAVAVMAGVLWSCDKERAVDEMSGLHRVTLNARAASSETDATKAIFVANVKSNSALYWQKNDKIGVQAGGSESLYGLTLKDRTANLTGATFEGDISGTLGEYAVYPYNGNHRISGSTLTYHLPSDYDFSLSDLDVDYLDSSDNVDSYKTSANPALLAKISGMGEGDSGATCEFKHLGGVLCIRIDKTVATYFDLTITADRQISGDFSVDLTSSEPVIKTTSDATADPDVIGTNNYVTVKGRITDLNKGCVCYIPMPVGKYNLKVKLGYDTPNYGKWEIVSPEKNVEVGRCEVKRASLKSSTMYKNGGYMLVKGIKYVDLGLPSGNLWATTNVGASLPADYGGFYTLSEMTSALGSKKCHIPSDTEFQELIDNTDKEYTSGEKNSSGEWTAGAYFKNKTDGSCRIFFPFSGVYQDDSSPYHKGVESCSWSSVKLTENNYDYQKFLSVSLSNGQVDAQVSRVFTWYKLTIRPVLTP